MATKILLEVSEELHTALKTKCALTNVTVADYLRKLISWSVNKDTEEMQKLYEITTRKAMISDDQPPT